jgi:hypothetical protein
MYTFVYKGGGSSMSSNNTLPNTATSNSNNGGSGGSVRTWTSAVTAPAFTPVSTTAFTPARPPPQQQQQHGSAEALHQQRLALQQDFELRSQLSTAINSSAARQCVKDNLRVCVRAATTATVTPLTQVAAVVDSGISAQQLQLEHALRSELSTIIGNSAVSDSVKHRLLSQLLSYTTDHMLQQQQELQQQQQQQLVPSLQPDHTAVQRIHSVQVELLAFIANTGHDGVRAETQEKWQQCILAANAPELSHPRAAVVAENLYDAAIDVQVRIQGQWIQLILNSGVAANIIDLWIVRLLQYGAV